VPEKVVIRPGKRRAPVRLKLSFAIFPVHRLAFQERFAVFVFIGVVFGLPLESEQRQDFYVVASQRIETARGRVHLITPVLGFSI